MKVLLINNFHYRKGGTETVYFGMADMLRRHGHEVIFFSCLSSRNESDGVNEFFVPNNYDVPKICGAARYVYNRRAARSLDALLSKHRPDIAHIHLFWGLHDYRGDSPKPEHPPGTGEDVIHGKGVQRG